MHEGDDGDGICDDVDTCVGELDEAACNGPGPTEVVIEDVTILYDSCTPSQLISGWSSRLVPIRCFPFCVFRSFRTVGLSITTVTIMRQW